MAFLEDSGPYFLLRNNATVKRYLVARSHAFTMAVEEWHWCEDNPRIHGQQTQRARGRGRSLSDDERHCLLAVCQASRKSRPRIQSWSWRALRVPAAASCARCAGQTSSGSVPCRSSETRRTVKHGQPLSLATPWTSSRGMPRADAWTQRSCSQTPQAKSRSPSVMPSRTRWRGQASTTSDATTASYLRKLPRHAWRDAGRDR